MMPVLAPVQARISLDQLGFIGTGLSRPECLLTHRSGLVFAADWTGHGGVSIIAPDESGDGSAPNVTRILARHACDALKPNGIALEPGGSFLLAHLGAETGGLFRLFADGCVQPVVTHVEGQALPPCNFPLLDRKGRVWLTVSTRVTPRADDYRPSAATGFIVLVENGVARIVAEGLGYANECALSADEAHLFVNETFARRLTRFEVAIDGTLNNRTTVAQFGIGTFPDGVALDVEGHALVTSIVSNRVIRVAPNSQQTLILEDADQEHLLWVEQAFQAGIMGRPHLDGAKSQVLRNISSLAFGGNDLKTAHLGCLLDDRVPMFRAAVAGLKPVHFDFDLGQLARSSATSRRHHERH